MNTVLNDGFSYQLDIIIPNYETNFKDIIQSVSGKHSFYLLKQIRLDQLLSEEFTNTFIKDGEFYLHSFNTKLEIHDCVSLLPKGKLHLNLTESSYERIPCAFKKRCVQRKKASKFDLEILLLELHKYDANSLATLKSAFKALTFSFFCCWTKQLSTTSTRSALDSYFARTNVSACINRCDASIKRCSESLATIIESAELPFASVEAYLELEEAIGTIIHDIKEQNGMKIVSVLRLKGFFPNTLLTQLYEDYIRELLNGDVQRVYLKIHGFQDSTVSLLRLVEKKDSVGMENFVTFCFKQNDDKQQQNTVCVYYGFNEQHFCKVIALKTD